MNHESGILQPIQAVLALQVHLRPLTMIPPNDSPYPQTCGLKKIGYLACIEAQLLPGVLLDLLQHIQAVLALEVHLRPLAMVPNDSPYLQTCGLKKIRSLACIEAELLPEVLFDLLQPIQAVPALQVHLRPLAMVPNDSLYPKTWVLKKIRSLACSETELLHEVLLDLLQPVQAVLALQAHLGPLKMVPNNSLYPKNLGFKKIRSL